MSYIYKDRAGRVVAISESPIQFNEKLFPSLAEIEPIKEETKAKTTTRRSGSNKDKE